MVKSVLSVSHRGLRDWAFQRVSAVLMAVYFIGLIGYLVSHPDLSFAEWRSLFAHDWVKIATILCVVSLLFHAWVGMWTILTDYVKCYVARCCLHLTVLIMLASCFIWALMIVWSV